MSDSIKKAYEITSIEKDINERQQIIDTYFATGQLDREKAISKIQLLRLTDEKVMTVTVAQLAQSSVPFSEASDESIVEELKMQVDILSAELIKKATEQ